MRLQTRWLMIPAVVLGLAGVAWAGGHGPGAHGPHHGGPMWMLEHALDELGDELALTDAQEAAIEARVAEARADFRAQAERRHDEDHGAFVVMLLGETVDRDGLLAHHAERVARMEQLTAQGLEAAADVAEILTPVQRMALAERLAERREAHHAEEGERGRRRGVGPRQR